MNKIPVGLVSEAALLRNSRGKPKSENGQNKSGGRKVQASRFFFC